MALNTGYRMLSSVSSILNIVVSSVKQIEARAAREGTEDIVSGLDKDLQSGGRYGSMSDD